MNPTSLPLDGAADEQASLWAARLDGSTLVADDRTALDAWLEESPAHRSLLSHYCQISADLEHQLPALVAAGALERPATGRRRRHRAWIAATAMAAAAAALALWWPPRVPAQSETVVTPAAHRQALALVDGSRIELDALTRLRVDIGNGRRLVHLASGEAFFTVAHDPAHPFWVETPAGSAQVTGTRFDIRIDAQSRLRVTVVDGTVLVHPHGAGGGSGATLPLTAGDQLTAGPDGIEVRLLSAARLDDALAWRQGQVVFHDTPLREALEEFSRYHGLPMEVTTAAGRLRLGGRYSLDDLQGFLSALEQIEPVHVNRRPDGTLQVSLRSGP